MKEDHDDFEEGIREKYKFYCSDDSYTDFFSYLRSLTDEDLERMKKMSLKTIMKKYIVEDGFTKGREGYWSIF